MALSSVHDVLREGGSRIMTLVKGQPLLQRSVDYVNDHPWTSLGVATGALIAYKIITRPRNLPPGPFNFPFIGPLFVLQEDMEVKLMEMRETYGEVIYFNVMGSGSLFLNSARVIREAFVKREEDFSHRRPSHLLEAYGMDQDEIFCAPYNDTWKANKKFAVMALKNFGFGTAKSEEKINQNLNKLEAVFLEHNGKPFSPMENFKMSSTANIFSIFFSEDLALDDPKLLELNNMIMDWFKALSEGGMMLDFILFKYPLLCKALCYGSVKRGYNASQCLLNHIKGMIQEHRSTFDSSNIRDVIDYYLLHKGHLDDIIIASNLSITLPDSIDSTALVLGWLLFYINYFEDVQRKLREEIDSVLGKNQNPSVSDKSKLPYTTAVILETLRYANLLPIGVARMTNSDIQFEGYTIPKGTSVQHVSYSVHFDPAIFPKPENFDPERFIDAEGKLDQSLASNVIPFGIGRRMCIGEQYTKSLLLLTLVRLVQKFDVTFDPSQPKPPLKPSDVGGFFKPPAEHKLCMIARH